MKTGALISAATQLGGIAAGATREQLKQLDRYAQALGLAFQVRDDMLEEEGRSPEQVLEEAKPDLVLVRRSLTLYWSTGILPLPLRGPWPRSITRYQ